MKKVITIFFVVTVLFNSVFAADKNAKPVTPIPEVIQCENQGNCKMTQIEVLLQREKEKKETVSVPSKDKSNAAKNR